MRRVAAGGKGGDVLAVAWDDGRNGVLISLVVQSKHKVLRSLVSWRCLGKEESRTAQR